jgi:CRP-like cAMP-binding protein
MDAHLQKINAFLENLDADVKTALDSISKTEHHEKGAYLLRQGDVCKKSYFVEEGIVRKFYLDEGKEITTEICFRGDLAVSFNSYVQQKPSEEFIQAVTKTTVSVTDHAAFQNLKTQFPVLTQLDLLMTEHYAMWLEERLFQFHTLNATQRYSQLIAKEPQFVRHVPLTYIASYLGISLETLSRIRAKS